MTNINVHKKDIPPVIIKLINNHLPKNPINGGSPPKDNQLTKNNNILKLEPL